jgi:hypothetical protein
MRWRKRWPAIGVAALVCASGAAGVGQPTPELVRQRVEREWAIKADKMRRLLQPLMRKHGIDLWVILSRENTPDPLLELFGGYGITGWYGHRNAYLFYDPGGDRPLETTAIGTHLSGHLKRFFGTLHSYGEEGLKPHLAKYIAAREPRRIAINQSKTISMADGLTAELKAYLLDTIGAERAARLVSSENLVVDYVSRHTPEEDAVARETSRATYELLRRALSNEVIEPGRTRLMDVYYWIVAEWKRQGYEFNFPPSLDVQRSSGASLDDAADPVIERGDVLHVDFGLRSSGIVTDQQKMAYVLREGETAPPAGLVRAFADSVRAAQIVASELTIGRTGVEIKRAAERRAKAEGIELTVYSHVQGHWVHDAGVWMVFDWPERYGAHPRFVLQGGEWVSLEFATTTSVPEWKGAKVRMLREEDVKVHEDGRVEYLSGPQEALWVIR